MNATTQQTPAADAWTVYENDQGFSFVRSDPAGLFIAAMTSGENDLDRLNARLMASAPRLAAALAAVNEWSITAQDGDFPYAIVELALKSARGR